MPALACLAATLLVPAALLAAPTPALAKDSPDRLAVGDSVMLGAKPALRERGFRVDATESRQAYSAPALLRAKGAKLPTTVVVHLGTNGTFPRDTCRRLVRTAGPERRVFLVTVFADRSWEKGNNAMIRRCAAGFEEGRVSVIDWQRVAKQHPRWFYRDGIHLKPAGRLAFARLLDIAVDRAEREASAARTQALMGASGSGVAGLQG